MDLGIGRVDYAFVAGITTRERNDTQKAETLRSLQAAVASIPAYARMYLLPQGASAPDCICGASAVVRLPVFRKGCVGHRNGHPIERIQLKAVRAAVHRLSFTCTLNRPYMKDRPWPNKFNLREL